MTTAVAKVCITLASGVQLTTFVQEDELNDGETVEDLIEDAVHYEGKPEWAGLGDVLFHPQAASAIQIVEEYDNEERQAA